MNLLLFIIILISSFVVVRVGAIAFELTGLEWSLAKFQALSCFTGTGFTTRESELITGNLQRRRIASILMVLGNAGLVTLIATFANSLRPNIAVPDFTIPFLHLVFPSRLLPWINLFILIVAVFLIYKVLTSARITGKLTGFLKRRIVKRRLFKPVSFEELLVATGGYGVSNIEICKDSPVLNKTLAETKLRSRDITVLAVEKNGQIIPNPPADIDFILGDRIMCFGKLENIKKEICPLGK